MTVCPNALDPTDDSGQDAGMHDVDVVVTSPETAQDGVAEFSVDGEMFAFSVLDDEEVVIHLLPRDGEPLLIGARSMLLALERARTLLS